MRRPAVLLLVALALGCADGTGPSGFPEADALVASPHHICHLGAAGAACWGQGDLGQLGTGSATSAATPAPVAGTVSFKAIVTGYTHTCALDMDGGAWCWGSDINGELGAGTTPDQSCRGLPCQTRPVRVATGERFTQLAAGDMFTCGLATSGTVFCWGYNDKGQLGTTARIDTCNSLPCSRTPTASGGTRTYARITAGRSSVCALTSRGETWCWGYDGISVVGSHAHNYSAVPWLNSDSLAFASVSSGNYHSCALEADGTAWCWGIDALGAGPEVGEADQPAPVTGNYRFREIRAGTVATCALDTHGQAFCWGINADGAVGVEPIGSTVFFDSPQPVATSLRFVHLGGGGGTFCGTTSNGSVACWGRGTDGQLLNGGTNSSAPVMLGLDN